MSGVLPYSSFQGNYYSSLNSFSEKCEKGWKHFEGKCFKYFGEIKSWLSARESCGSLNARLAVVDNEGKNKYVKRGNCFRIAVLIKRLE